MAWADLRLPLLTDRLELRPLQVGDVPALVEIYDAESSRYLYDEPHDTAAATTMVRERGAVPTAEADDSALRLMAVTRATGEPIGTMVVGLRSVTHRQGEIGYVLHRDHRGHGYAVEGATAMLALGFEVLGCHRMTAQCDGRNAASIAVMRRLGMRQEAHLVHNEGVKGEWTDEIVFAMLASDWAAAGR